MIFLITGRKNSSVNKARRTGTGSRSSRDKDRGGRDLVEDLSLYSMDNGPNLRPQVDVPALNLR